LKNTSNVRTFWGRRNHALFLHSPELAEADTEEPLVHSIEQDNAFCRGDSSFLVNANEQSWNGFCIALCGGGIDERIKGKSNPFSGKY
jgi:hypothetical protein